MEQRTEEWFAARLGRVTASRIADVVAKTKTGYGAGRANYMAELACERLTGQRAESFTSKAMQHGTDTEPRARAAYELLTGASVVEVGFIARDDMAAGASPDGLVGHDGLIEIKCPNTATHIDYLIKGSVPGNYALQMQWQMACTGRQWCDFVSFDPRLPVDLEMWIKRVDRDEALIADLEAEVRKFLGELDEMMDKLGRLK
jgi:putative phage-type endonuclease